MKKSSNSILILTYIAFTLSLFVIEILVFIFIAESILLFTEYRFNLGYVRDTFVFSVCFNLIKFIYYYQIQVLPFIWLMSGIRNRNRVLKIAILNCAFYIFISLLYGFIFIPETKEYFTKAFFYTFIVATFASPFILNKIPYYKNLIASMKGATPSHADQVEDETETHSDDIVVAYLNKPQEKSIRTGVVVKYIIFTLSLFVMEAFLFTAESMFFVHKHHFQFQYMWDMVMFCLH